MKISIESLNLQMLNIGLAKHNGNWNWKEVMSPFTRIFLVTEGNAKLYMQDRCINLRPNYLYIVPAHTMHSYECNGKFTHYYLHFYEGYKKEVDIFDIYDFPTEVGAEMLDKLVFSEMCKHFPMAKLPASDPTTYDYMGKFLEYLQRYNNLSVGEKLKLRGSILLLLSRFIEQAHARIWTQDKRLIDALNYIQSNIDKEIKVDELASLVCLTKPHLIRLFSKTLGNSPLQYINKKKVERAQQLLITEDCSIQEIAYRLGFNDPSYFIRLFKKIAKITPMKYRHNMT